MENKYELTDEVIEYLGHTLHRIKALKDFGDIKKGQLGGFVESSSNLSQNKDCWIWENAIVYANARISNNAKIFDNAQIYGNAWICNNAKIFGNARVGGYSMIFDNAVICENAVVYGNPRIEGSSKICGDAYVNNNPIICGDSIIKQLGDYMVFQNTWSSGEYITWTKSNNMWHTDFFNGTGDELIEEAYKDSEKSGKNYEAYVNLIKII